MKTYVWLTFAFLGWGYYEASGGADFQPGAASAGTEVAQADISVPEPAGEPVAGPARQPAAYASVQHRVESALLVALRDAPGATEAAKEPLKAVALSAVTRETPFAPERPVALDTTPRPKPKPDLSPRIDERATAAAPETSLRPRLRPVSETAGPDMPVISTRGGAEAGHEVIVAGANLRMGPGTNFPVLDTLEQGTRVRFLRKGEDGWVKLKAADHGRIGWMAGYLIAER